MLPSVSANSSSYIWMLYSLASVAYYLVIDEINYSYLLLLGSLALLSSIFGITIVNRISNRTKRESIYMIPITIIIFACLFVIIIKLVIEAS